MKRDFGYPHGIHSRRVSRWSNRLTALTVLTTLLAGFQLHPTTLVRAEEVEDEADQQQETVQPIGSLTGRAGHLAFETFGRTDSITHVELMPYLDLDQVTLFADTRFFMSNDGYCGGNVGFGYRYRTPEADRFVGASFWYDIDDTTGELFHQLGVSLESCGSLWDVRTNLYFPIGDFEKDYQVSVYDRQFVGNQIVFTDARTYGEAMKGFDLELGIPIPTEFARAHNLSITPGTYMFFGDTTEDIYGYKVRAEGNVTKNVGMQVEMTDDETFGTTVMFGFEFVMPGGSRFEKPADTSSRIRTDQFVHRNYNIIVSKQVDYTAGLTAMNPETGLAYSVQHVSSAAWGTELGTPDNPYHTIADAQAAGADIIFVHADSVLSDAIVMEEGVRILGEGVNHSIQYDGYGIGLLPTVNSSTTRPTLLGVSGTAVTLASNSELSGFVIDSPTGYGIVGNSVENFAVRNVDLLNAGLDGVYLQDVDGDNTFYNLAISGVVGTAVHLDGGDSDTSISGTVANSSGRAVVVENTVGGHANLSGLVVNDNGGEGILVDNAAGNVSFGTVNVRNSTTTGIAVDGASGEVTFEDALVSNAASTAVDIRNTTGSFAFGDLDVINQTGGPGVSIVDSTAEGIFSSLEIETDGATGLLVQNGGDLAIEAGNIETANGTAVDIENATVDANLTSVSSSNATVGIRIVDHDGQFLIVGNGSESTGGLIQNATTGALIDNAGTVGFQYVDFEGNGVGLGVTDTDYLALSYVNVADSTRYGLDALNVSIVEVTGSVFDDNGGAGYNSIRFRSDTEASYGLFLSESTITDATDAALAISTFGSGDDSSLTLQVSECEITTSLFGASGVNAHWNGQLVGSILYTEFEGTGGSNTGIDITTSSTSELVELAISHNTFAFDGGDDVGVDITTLGPSTIAIGWNTIDFDASGGTGLQFNLAESAEAYVYSNDITDNVSGATGILFQSITGPSTVTLQSNNIYLLSETSVIDRGIIFSSVSGTVELLDPMNNIVTGATTLFYAPVGTLDGYTYVNSERVP